MATLRRSKTEPNGITALATRQQLKDANKRPIKSVSGRSVDEMRNRKSSVNAKVKLVTLASFVPAILLEQIPTILDEAEELENGDIQRHPSMFKYVGAVMITDISGFVGLTEELTAGKSIALYMHEESYILNSGP